MGIGRARKGSGIGLGRTWFKSILLIGSSMKHLLCKHGDLSLIPQIHHLKKSMEACACNPSAGEAEAGGFWAFPASHSS